MDAGWTARGWPCDSRGDAADRVEALAAAERACCAFLTYQSSPDPDAGDRGAGGRETTLEGFAALADQALRV